MIQSGVILQAALKGVGKIKRLAALSTATLHVAFSFGQAYVI
jgi:hypothetical protein